MAAAGGVTNGAYGYCKINSTVVLVRTNAALNNPRNSDMPHPINGAGIGGVINAADGLNFPVVNVPAIPMDLGASAGWFTAANLNSWFITRSAAPVGDLGELTSLILSANGSVGNGCKSWKVNKGKGAGFTLVVRKGQGVGMQMRFAGRNRQKALVADRPSAPLVGDPLMFDRLSLGTELDGKGIVGVTLQYDTGLTPNNELDNSLHPVEQNAGLPSGTLTLETQALDTVAPPGYNPTTDTWEDVDAADFSILSVASGTPVSVVFTMARLRIRNPFDIQTQANRVMQTYVYDLLGTATQPAILAIA